MTKISIMMDLGVPQETRKEKVEECPRRPIEDQVRDSLELIESDRDSSVEFRAINGLYDQLCKLKQTDRIKNLRSMIKPVLSKYGYHKD